MSEHDRRPTRVSALLLTAAMLLSGIQHASASDSGPPADEQTLIGAAVKPHDPRTELNQEIAFLEAAVGPLEIRRVFDTAWAPDFATKAGIDFGVRATHYSFKPDMNQLAAGNLDDQMRSFLATIPAGHRTILTIWHEPEDNFTTDETQATYRAAWQRFADIVHASGRPELSTAWVMMAWSWRGASGRDPSDWFPGVAYVDYVGIDAYNEGSLSGDGWDSPGRALGMPFAGENPPGGGYVGGGPLQWVRDRGLAWGISEFGTLENDSGYDAAWAKVDEKWRWVKRAVRFYTREGASFIEYFHSGPYRGPWWLDSSPEALEAYRWAVTKY